MCSTVTCRDWDVANGEVTVSYERGSTLYSKEAPTGPLAKDEKS